MAAGLLSLSQAVFIDHLQLQGQSSPHTPITFPQPAVLRDAIFT